MDSIRSFELWRERLAVGEAPESGLDYDRYDPDLLYDAWRDEQDFWPEDAEEVEG